MITIELTDQEAKDYLALREACFFDLEDTDIVIHKDIAKVITDIKKPGVKPKDIYVSLYRRKKIRA